MIGDGGGLHICVRVIFVDIGSKFKNLAMYFQSYLRLDFTMSLPSLSLIINFFVYIRLF